MHNLPNICLVGFNACRLKKPHLALFSRREWIDFNRKKYIFKTLPYVVNEGDTDDEIDAVNIIRLYAERYGSVGRSPHAGGGRVGLIEKYQIKGIGKTPLCSTNETDFSYSSGEVSIQECVHELIWSDVIDTILPYGSTRCYSALYTGTYCLEDNGNHNKARPRGLLIRAPNIRPAHFMRSVYDRLKSSTLWASDANRVTEAMASLESLLPMPNNHSLGENLPFSFSFFDRRFHEFIRRMAEQYACAKSMRIMHGSLTASNVTLNGSWIDFGSTNRPPVYASNKDYYPSFWSDQINLETIISRFVFQISKYGNYEFYNCENTWVSIFVKQYNNTLIEQFVFAAGFPKWLVRESDLFDSESLEHCGRLVIAVAKHGRVSANCEESDLPHLGRHDFFEVMLELILSFQPIKRNINLQYLSKFHSKLRNAHAGLMNNGGRMLERLGFDSRRITGIMIIELVKRQSRTRILESGFLINAINEVIMSSSHWHNTKAKFREIHDTALAQADILIGSILTGKFLNVYKSNLQCLIFDLSSGILLEKENNITKILTQENFHTSILIKEFVANSPLSPEDFFFYVTS